MTLKECLAIPTDKFTKLVYKMFKRLRIYFQYEYLLPEKVWKEESDHKCLRLR